MKEAGSKMNHTKYTEDLRLYLLEELNDEEKLRLENHLLECAECSAELEELRRLDLALKQSKPNMPDEFALETARKNLWNEIVIEKEKKSFNERTVDWVKRNLSPAYRFVLGSAAALAFGFLLGYLIFSGAPSRNQMIPLNISNVDELMRNDYRFSNIRFDENPSASGEEFEITFDAVRPIKIKGKPDEELIKNLMISALTTSENPGIRLRTINRISSNSGQYLGQDPKIKEALITAMVGDENPGVRKEALNVLMQYPIDEKIKEAFLSVLSNDPNSGMRVSAINALVKLKMEGRTFDEEVTNTLESNAANDKNKFVQLRAAALLKEAK